MLTETQDNEEIIARVAALDIGKAELVCCARVPDEDRPGRLQEVETYATMTRSLVSMADRLRCLGVTRVVMEATSDYWKPVFYLLEAAGSGDLAGERQGREAPAGAARDRQAGRGMAGQGRRAADDPAGLRPPAGDPAAA